MSTPKLLLASLLGLLLAACGPRFVKGTEIEYSPEKQAIANLVERYRKALSDRDASTLKAMISRNYYENASTTSNPRDDYGYDGLSRLLEELKSKVKEVRYAVTIKAIDVFENTAVVDFDYEAQYLYETGAEERWANRIDRNRLTFRMEEGKWRIIGGL